MWEKWRRSSRKSRLVVQLLGAMHGLVFPKERGGEIAVGGEAAGQRVHVVGVLVVRRSRWRAFGQLHGHFWAAQVLFRVGGGRR